MTRATTAVPKVMPERASPDHVVIQSGGWQKRSKAASPSVGMTASGCSHRTSIHSEEGIRARCMPVQSVHSTVSPPGSASPAVESGRVGQPPPRPAGQVTSLVKIRWQRTTRRQDHLASGEDPLSKVIGGFEVERRRTSPPPANSPSLARRRCPLTEVLDRLPNDFDHWLRCRSMPLVCSARGVAATRVPQRGLNGNPIRWSPPSRSCFVRVLCRSGWARPGS